MYTMNRAAHRRNSTLLTVTLLLMSLMLISCSGMKNPDRQIPEENETGTFVTVRDGTEIFAYEYVPSSEFKNTIYIVSGITGINHKMKKTLLRD